MPTGYTSALAEGEVEFTEFVLSCARAIGYLARFRDAPEGSEAIPDVIQPSSYPQSRVDGLTRELNTLQALTDVEAEAAAETEWRASEAGRLAHADEQEARRQRYTAMMAKVEAWVPPTPAHGTLREFMLRELQQSLDWDCDPAYAEPPTERLDGAAWKARQIELVTRQLAVAQRNRLEEIDSARVATEWVRALRDSLPSPARKP